MRLSQDELAILACVRALPSDRIATLSALATRTKCDDLADPEQCESVFFPMLKNLIARQTRTIESLERAHAWTLPRRERSSAKVIPFTAKEAIR
jgi:hypothetical protein